MYQGLRYHLQLPRVAMQRARAGWGKRLAVGSLRWETLPDPDLKVAAPWLALEPRMSGICGSDLGVLTGRASPYLAPLTSFPAVLGHEVVAEVQGSAGPWPRGTRVVVDPTLGCRARGLPLCSACAEGRDDGCERRADSNLGPGLLLGFHSELPGGWSTRMWAPQAQLYPLPDALPTRRAVLTEPLAIVAAGLAAMDFARVRRVLVLGAGTLGLLATWWLSETHSVETTVLARYPHQAALARQLGAARLLADDGAGRADLAGAPLGRPLFGAPPYHPGGVDLTVDTVGSASTFKTALELTRPDGQILVLGALQSPARDLTPVWARRLTIRGSYGYRHRGASVFPHVLSLLPHAPVLDALVTRTWPLDRYPDAIASVLDHRGGTVKAAFEARPD